MRHVHVSWADHRHLTPLNFLLLGCRPTGNELYRCTQGRSSAPCSSTMTLLSIVRSACQPAYVRPLYQHNVCNRPQLKCKQSPSDQQKYLHLMAHRPCKLPFFQPLICWLPPQTAAPPAACEMYQCTQNFHGLLQCSLKLPSLDHRQLLAMLAAQM
ncbi:hypothetical protein DPMN_094251 [Dreissena polymorpha]|uniref:Uncharacterized protein n=1 Tax=Dreissena polymorpha TaxID=45954 RepID=A0A9D4L561_DREPO|nr:hypothetical protein DPMN_094251 [Dreissena polymorpha]